ncbi:MAG: YicC/YloC family endoribonuclease [Pseudomonadota bacterium]
MIRSMTGFARVSASSEFGELSWEIRAVNHRYLDVQFRLPDELRGAETDFRQAVTAATGRGKLDCAFFVKRAASARGSRIDAAALAALRAQIDAVVGALPGIGAPSALDVLRWPGVIEEGTIEHDALTTAAHELLNDALAALNRMREREGERLAALLRERCDTVAALARDVRARRADVVAGIQERLRERLNRLDTEVEPGRIEAELVLIAQKLDVDEELDRLESHLQEIATVLERDEPVGRRLDFLMQELNREANTLASKSGDGETTRAAVDLKVLIEQMREQIQNIE